jgi:hypothetical protein
LRAAITGALGGTGSPSVPTGVGDGVDQARTVLCRMLARLDGSRDLVVALAEGRVPEFVVHAVEHRLTRADEAALD